MNQPDSNYPSRCQYRNAAGRQCRSTHFGAASRLCPRHAALEEQFSQSPEDLTKLFALAPDKFQSPAGVHSALSELFTLLVQDRVSARRAAVLAYISSLMLRTLTAIQQEAAGEMAAAENAPPKIVWSIPRPSHERNGWQQPGIVRPPIAEPTASSTERRP